MKWLDLLSTFLNWKFLVTEFSNTGLILSIFSSSVRINFNFFRTRAKISSKIFCVIVFCLEDALGGIGSSFNIFTNNSMKDAHAMDCLGIKNSKKKYQLRFTRNNTLLLCFRSFTKKIKFYLEKMLQKDNVIT